MKSIVIFGAGIAGLSAAHELVQLGYIVSVYEASDQPGGFFRSAHLDTDNMPSEYSWHGMGPWYHNAFDLMQKIPFDEKGSIYDLALSRPVDFGIFPDTDKAQFYDEGLRSIPKMFRMNTFEFSRISGKDTGLQQRAGSNLTGRGRSISSKVQSALDRKMARISRFGRCASSLGAMMKYSEKGNVESASSRLQLAGLTGPAVVIQPASACDGPSTF